MGRQLFFSALLPAGTPIQWAKPHTLAVAKGRPNHDSGAGFGHVLLKSGQVVRVDHPLEKIHVGAKLIAEGLRAQSLVTNS